MSYSPFLCVLQRTHTRKHPSATHILFKDISLLSMFCKCSSCRELVQEHIIRQDLSPQAATALGELLTCGLLMGAGLKDEESLQLNLVSADRRGLRNIMVITDGELKARGQTGNPRFSASSTDSAPLKMRDMLGEGQVQVSMAKTSLSCYITF